jgi:hypothetical protein
MALPSHLFASSTPRSSITAVTEDDKNSLKRALEQEIKRDELHFEKYGGDDITDPPLKTESPKKQSHEPEEDPNLVSWDGPNDAANPQNWPRKYKWIITVICSIMTVNV